MTAVKKYDGLEIAVIGMSAQFPGSNNYLEYWENLKSGRESIKTFSDEELRLSGVPEHLLKNESFVKAQGVVEGKEHFDHAFFGYSAEEAAFMDPQIRMFHEHCWKALEDAGYASMTGSKKIGLFAGASINDNWKIYAHSKAADSTLDPFYLNMIMSQHFISTLVAYKLNLRGPSYYVDTACSTSLSAIHLASRSLLTRECNMALAGGICIRTAKRKGYLYRPDMIASKDGHCRAFDEEASGTASGEGVGIVVLKKLSEAMKDGDHIYAIIKASVVNNDGNFKVGYTAPSVKGQAECIAAAHKLAGVSAQSISYIEAHGTGTALGDPIEIRGLNEAFATGGDQKFCAIGSVKTNIGHLDAAAGVAGLIKTVLALKYQQLPASLHFQKANPEIDFDGGPFYVNTRLQQWQRKGDTPLRAGVSSLGIGGTNAHAVLEEAPEQPQSIAGRRYKILPLSARTSQSLTQFTTQLQHFINKEQVNVADMAYTLQVGRRHFTYRLPLVCEDAATALSVPGLSERIVREAGPLGKTVFMFPGQGSQYAGMGTDLYNHEPVFRQHMDAGFALITKLTGENYQAVLTDAARINDTRYAQPLIFLFEYSLSRLLISWGIRPSYMIGHSIGEYVAACISGVFSFEDALHLLVRRGEMMAALPPGAMLSVGLDEEAVKPFLGKGISLAAVNSARQVVLSGDLDAIALLEQQLKAADVAFVRLHTSHAFHSAMQDIILPAYQRLLKSIHFGKIEIPFVSNLTGKLITSEALSPAYWVRHLRETVRFSDGIQTLLSAGDNPVFIELGARTLVPLLQKRGGLSVSLLRSPKEDRADDAYLLEGVAKLWAHGLPVDWTAFNEGETRRRVSLPTYCFEPVKYPAEVDVFADGLLSAMSDSGKELKDWVYYPTWKRSEQPLIETEKKQYLFFTANNKLSQALCAELDNVKQIHKGEDYMQVLSSLQSPADIIYGWSLEEDDPLKQYFELADVIKAASQFSVQRLTVLTNSLHQVYGDEQGAYSQSLLLGLLQVVPQEYGLSCTNIDLDEHVSARLLAAVLNNSQDRMLAIRKGHLWIYGHERNKRTIANTQSRIKEGGTYLITGGLGNAGYVLARHLASRFKARLVLIGRQVLNDGSKASERLLKLQETGAAITYYSADISDADAIETIVSGTGHIDGVIHAAGIVDYRYFEPLSSLSSENTLKVLSPKMQGLETLYTVFKDRHPDFVWITSSLSGVLGGLGYATYAAANLYMDHLVSARKADLPGWISVALSGLTFTSEDAAKDNASLSPEELVSLFDWSIGLQHTPQITIYKGDLATRIQQVYTAPQKIVEDIPVTERPSLSTTYIAAATPTEEKLIILYEQFFGISGIGTADNFFELGGDSLKAMILLKRIKHEFNVNPSLKDFFELRTIKGVADYIQATGKGPEENKILNIPAAVIDTSYPLSSSQRRLWILSQFDDSNAAYNLSGRYRFEGNLHIPALETAFDTLIDRHEILRTVFREDAQGEIKQFVLPAKDLRFSLLQHDLRNDPDQVNHLVTKELVKPFDLSTGPLLRAALFRLTDDAWGFVYVMHHIISDGWSMDILMKELLQLYNGFVHGTTHLLPPLRIQYKDYASWQQDHMTGKTLSDHADYWKKQFEGELPVLQLPIEGPRPGVKTYNGGMIRRKISQAHTQDFKSLLQQEGSTLFMGLLATVNALLYRYTTQEDIIIGSPIAGREHADLEDQIGFYVNTLALRTRFSGQESFRSLLEKVRQLTLEAYEHQMYPFDELVDQLSLQRDVSRNPLFDIMVVLLNTRINNTEAAQLHDVKVKDFDNGGHQISKFDLTFNFAESEQEELFYTIEYNSDLFKLHDIEKLSEHFECLLDAIIKHAGQPLYSLHYIREEELQLLSIFGKGPEISFPETQTILHLFEQQVKNTPDTIALLSGDVELTYAMLNTQANRLAWYLKNTYSIAPDELVGVKLQRNEWLIISLLAVLKAGAAYVPIDPAYPAERVEYMLNDSRCKLMIDNEELEKFKAAALPDDPGNPDIIIKASDLAYVIYTSGSTGNPKGVMIEHQNVHSFVQWAATEFKDADFDVVFAVTSVCFDLSVFEIFYSLCFGKKVRILENALLINDYLNVHAKILLNTVPAVVGALLNEHADLANVKVLNMAGEPIPQQIIAGLDLRQIEVRNLYGPSEYTTYSTIYRITKNSKVLIGVPIANTTIYILDSNGQQQPIGIPGEIAIRGAGLSRGYINKPGLTAEKFIPDPSGQSGKVYMTGDLGRWLPDGNIEFLGRKDDQVKVRGYRIEPGEIETILEKHPDLESAVVIVKKDKDGNRGLTAYLVGKKELNTTEIRAYLGSILPPYMLPDHYVQLTSLPVTPSGKIDKKVLSAMNTPALSGAAEYMAPRNETEEKLVQIWQEILGIEKVGIQDNFFDLGGNSFKMMKMLGLIRKTFDRKIPLVLVFRLPNIKALVDYLHSDGKDSHTQSDHDARTGLNIMEETFKLLNHVNN
ncbi:hybrid non-ribosomal peptide synthetase/type I polyketide synthase [Chitinophaga silvisoli]|uniref:Amino acid adenylation domain-containing protein n=1 Tax=Chitinophaga silvisoli TaxID=2291814 RepID=A0A3E1P0I0_9BACT|nr:non-ribosomal peptide synthetase/type I polyketide synthase [Chitinophaga silvisoli]RFM33508.1 amino acid adenylation domain-containing protein [Chitinophaga silvisoli]